MPKIVKPHVKLACLACRASKTRCDGKQPCLNCQSNRRECLYRPSQRGGARRGHSWIQKQSSPTNQPLPKDDWSDDGDLRFPSPPSRELSVLGSIPGPSDAESRRSSTRPLAPPGRVITTWPNSDDPLAHPPVTLRIYRNSDDILNAYYIFIHPYFPILPPPPRPQYPDPPVAFDARTGKPHIPTLTQWESCPLRLALLALLVVIPVRDDPRAMELPSVYLRQKYAERYASMALECVEQALDRKWQPRLDHPPLHAGLPVQMEPVVTLALVGVFEYCQGKNTTRMRARANQALTMAMDLGMHEQETDSGDCDAQRRGWWLTMFLAYHSSILNGKQPIISMHDPRISTPFPVFRGCREPWPLLMRAQELMLKSCCISRRLTRQETTPLPQSLREEILEVDSLILQLAMEADRSKCVVNQVGIEAETSRTLWNIARAFIHTARLKLHRFRAFMDYPIFLGEHCDFPSINKDDPSEPSHQLSTTRMAEIDSLFPFSEHESARICLKSGLAISRIFRHLASPTPSYSDLASEEKTSPPAPNHAGNPMGRPRSLPYMVCCELQGFYALIMLLSRVRTAVTTGDLSRCYYLLDHPDPATEVGDADRLLEELKQGINTLCLSIRADVVYEGVVGIAKEVDGVYAVTFAD